MDGTPFPIGRTAPVFINFASEPTMTYRGLNQRPAAAAVEFAVVLPLLILVLIGVWEIGRLIQLQQIMNNAARDGARLASQATLVNADGATTQIGVDVGEPNVVDTVKDYLRAAGISNLDGLHVSFQFIEGDTTLVEPYEGVKNQRFRLRVTMPYENLRWTNLSLINPTQLGGECVWQMMVDDPFTLNPALPGWNP
jgi:hypothetical protein